MQNKGENTMEYIKKFLSVLLTVLTTVSMAFAGFNDSRSNEPFRVKDDNVLFNVTLLSDVHIDYRELFLQAALRLGVTSLKKSQSPIDAVVISGDLTNYGDKKSMNTMFKTVTECMPDGTQAFITTGNHDIGHSSEVDLTAEQARQNFIELHNKYLGTEINKIYYSRVIDGYTFITLSDESDDSWDTPEISDTQIAWLDSELSKATAANDMKPVFVVCHWSINGTNGQQIVWENGAMNDCSDKVRAVLEKYSNKNVFYISGHVHTGVNNDELHKYFDVYNVEEQNGIFYVNLPAFGSLNRYGVPWPGTGMQMEVYENEVIFRPRNYLSNKWYGSFEYSVTLH